MNRRLEVRPFIGYLLVVKDHRRRLVCANEVPEVFEFGKRNRNLSENPLGCCRPPNVLELVGDRLCRLIPFFPFVGIERRRVYRPVKFRYDPVTTSVLNPYVWTTSPNSSVSCSRFSSPSSPIVAERPIAAR